MNWNEDEKVGQKRENRDTRRRQRTFSWNSSETTVVIKDVLPTPSKAQKVKLIAKKRLCDHLEGKGTRRIERKIQTRKSKLKEGITASTRFTLTMRGRMRGKSTYKWWKSRAVKGKESQKGGGGPRTKSTAGKSERLRFRELTGKNPDSAVGKQQKFVVYAWKGG